MKIKCLTTFLDGTERFETDDIRTVPDGRGAYFVGAGWAEDISGQTAPGAATDDVTDLSINSSTFSTGDNHG